MPFFESETRRGAGTPLALHRMPWFVMHALLTGAGRSSDKRQYAPLRSALVLLGSRIATYNPFFSLISKIRTEHFLEQSIQVLCRAHDLLLPLLPLVLQRATADGTRRVPALDCMVLLHARGVKEVAARQDF